MRREIVAWLLVLSALALLFGFVWLTWHPEDPVFDRLVEWPLVGSPVERLRRIYLPSPRDADGARGARDGSGLRDSALAGVADGDTKPEWVFVGIGATFRSAPSASADRLLETRRLDQYRVLERAPGPAGWVLVALPDGRQAWVDLDAPRDRTPPLGSDPLPPGPLAARSASPEVLDLADSLLEEGWTETELAGYRLRTDAHDPDLVDRLRMRLGSIESVYAERYGVAPIGRPAETMVVFSREAAYRRFESRVPELRGVGSTGHAVGGVAALFVGTRSGPEVLATAVHEVTHLLNRRALGPALPPWLEEGLADELALLGLTRAKGEGSPYLGSLQIEGNTLRGSGPLAGLVLLLDRLEEGRLVPLDALVEQDWQDFREGPRGRDLYNQSGFFLHYLLERDRPRLAAGLRSFLAGVAHGEPPSGERLREAIGVSWTELERDFRVWLSEEGENAGAALLRRRPSDPPPEASNGERPHREPPGPGSGA